ncbi:MAG: DNA cytosine methyltransferase [Acidovorax sp.]|nr:DNA cytosine methyltransferase [Acidovorax sp.]
MSNYYNEIDKFAAQTLRNLIAAGHIAPGVVDERSIEDVHPDDLRGFTQCHFFAGIGVWSYALRRAGWPDDRPVWTGSCPCQPFSSAGEGAGFADERHLWPAFFHLIQQRSPATVFGEQVASLAANPWIDLVQDDLEGLGYRVGAVPFPSAGVGAPHIRDRLYWVAHADSIPGRKGRAHLRGRTDRGNAQPWPGLGSSGMPHGLADDHKHGRGALPIDRGQHAQHHVEPCGKSGGLGNPGSSSGQWIDGGQPGDGLARPGEVGRMEHAGQHDDAGQEAPASAWQPQADRSADQPGRSSLPSCGVADTSGGRNVSCISRPDQRGLSPSDGGHQGCALPGPVNGLWSAADWLLCRDGKWRPVEPGTFPLAHGAPARVGRLRAYGNAINAEAARVFIQAAMSCMP